MGRTALIAAVVSVLVAASAEAKEIRGAKVCGIEGCVAVEERADIEGMHAWGPELRGPPAPAPFYRVLFEVGSDRGAMPGFTLIYVPRARAVVQQAQLGSTPWFRTGSAEARLSVVTAKVRPYPAEMLERFAERDRARVADARRRLWRAQRRVGKPQRRVGEPQRREAASAAPLPLVAAGGAMLLTIGGIGLARRLRRRRAGA